MTTGAQLRRTVGDIYKNVELLFGDSFGTRPLETFKAATLKRIVRYYAPSASCSAPSSLPTSFTLEKRELVETTREVLWASFRFHALPVFVAAFVVVVITCTFLTGSLRKSRFTVKYNILAGGLRVLEWVNGLLMISVMLSWMQEPFQFPRVVLDPLFLNPVNAVFAPIMRQSQVTAWVVSNPFNINLLPIVLSYVVRKAVVYLQIYMTTVKMLKDTYTGRSDETERQRFNPNEEVNYNGQTAQSEHSDSSQPFYSSNSILEEHGKEGFLQASLDDQSSVVCDKCKQVVATTRFQQHKEFWCPMAEQGSLLEVDLDVDAGLQADLAKG